MNNAHSSTQHLCESCFAHLNDTLSEENDSRPGLSQSLVFSVTQPVQGVVTCNRLEWSCVFSLLFYSK